MVRVIEEGRGTRVEGAEHSTPDTRHSPFTYTGEVARVTDGAIGFKPPIYRGHIALCWIPKSQIIESDTDVDEIEVGEEVTVEIPLWLAREKGLV